MRSNTATKQVSGNTGLQVSVVERINEPGVWSVEAIDMGDDGDIFQAFFSGPEAKERAQEYAHFKYGHQ